MSITRLLLGAFLLTAINFSLTAKDKFDIKVSIINTESNDGQLVVYLYDNSEYYPKEKDKAMKVIKSKIKSNKSTVNFINIPNGKYAIAVHHDSNGNNEVDTNFLGIPNEGFGASNDAKGFMGPPSFEDASFDVKKDVEITINMD